MYRTHAFERLCSQYLTPSTLRVGEMYMQHAYCRVDNPSKDERVMYAPDACNWRFTRFKDNFLDKVGKYHADYHVFLISIDQRHLWQNCVEYHDLEKYIVHETPWVYNYNYVNEEPRLKLFVLKFPEGYQAEK